MKYLEKLSRAAYWQLSREEAADVMSDYQEMYEEKLLKGTDVSSDLGDPYQAIKPLRDEKQYFMWVSVFTAMLVCLLFITVRLFVGREYGLLSVAGLYIMGECLSVVYLRTAGRERRHEPYPKGLLLLLSVELILSFVSLSVAAVLFTSFSGERFQIFWKLLRPEMIGLTVDYIMCAAAAALAGISVFGLYKAKVSDRRWRALYCFGITIVSVSAVILAYMHSLDLWEAQINWIPCGILFGTGCVATGVSLY